MMHGQRNIKFKYVVNKFSKKEQSKSDDKFLSIEVCIVYKQSLRVKFGIPD